MIQVTPHMRIVVACDPVDFRKGIDGLAAVCSQKLAVDPFSGVMFVFANKSRQALRILVYDLC
jgi:transposase